jgi:hypothetical protein
MTRIELKYHPINLKLNPPQTAQKQYHFVTAKAESLEKIKQLADSIAKSEIELDIRSLELQKAITHFLSLV